MARILHPIAPMKFQIRAAMLATVLVLGASVAQADIIYFETQGTDLFSTSQTHQGFDWLFSASGWFVGPHDTASCSNCTSNGTSNLVAAGDRVGTANVLMTVNGGGTFGIFALDAATASTLETNQLRVFGTFSGGGDITQILNIDGTFGPYVLAGFVGLDSVLFSSVNSGVYNLGGFSIDNISTEPTVPEPATLLLLGGGLLAVGVRRYRRRSA